MEAMDRLEAPSLCRWGLFRHVVGVAVNLAIEAGEMRRVSCCIGFCMAI